MTLEELEAEALKLDPPARTELVRRLTASLAAATEGAPAQPPPAPPPPTDEEKERQWLQDALRRSRELRERQIQTEPPDRRPSSHSPLAVGSGAARRAKAKRQPKRKPAPKRSRAKPRGSRRPMPRKRAAARRPKPRRRPRPTPAKAHGGSRGKKRSRR
jgi:hypothetical protein